MSIERPAVERQYRYGFLGLLIPGGFFVVFSSLLWFQARALILFPQLLSAQSVLGVLVCLAAVIWGFLAFPSKVTLSEHRVTVRLLCGLTRVYAREELVWATKGGGFVRCTPAVRDGRLRWSHLFFVPFLDRGDELVAEVVPSRLGRWA